MPVLLKVERVLQQRQTMASLFTYICPPIYDDLSDIGFLNNLHHASMF